MLHITSELKEEETKTAELQTNNCFLKKNISKYVKSVWRRQTYKRNFCFSTDPDAAHEGREVDSRAVLRQHPVSCMMIAAKCGLLVVVYAAFHAKQGEFPRR